MPNKYTQVTLICAQCGEPFNVEANRAETAKFCSRTCYRTPGNGYGPRPTSHGEARNSGRSPEYVTWTNIKKRCLNPHHDAYPNYGGRGITVCEAWRESFDAFLADVGRKPSPTHSIERIDHDGNYEPSNVRWATSMEQGHNRRTNRMVTFNGVTQPLIVWAQGAGLSKDCLRSRLEAGWEIERALTTPARRW